MLLLVALALVANLDIPRSTMPIIGQPAEHCAPQDRRVSGDAARPSLRKLNDMPDAEPQYAVLREMDGCPIPAKVSAQKAKRR